MKKHKLKYSLTLAFLLLIAVISCKSTVNENQSISEKKDLLTDNKSFDEGLKLNDEEKLLDNKLEKLRKNLDSAFIHKSYSYFHHSFEENRKLIDTTKLYHLIQKMPKGALLHSHSKGLTNVKWLINTLKSYNNCYVFTNENSKQYLFGQLMIFDKNKAPKGFELLATKIKNPGFETKLYDAQVFRRFSLDSDVQFWPEFEKRFMRIGNVTNYRPFFREYHKKAFKDLISDNVKHLEIRYIFDPLFDEKNNAYPMDTTIKEFENILTEIRKENPDFKLRLIYTSLKFLDKEIVKSEFVKAYALRKKYPDFITGFDLVAEEDAGHSVSYFNSIWSLSDSLNDVYKTDMPLFMHAGESNSIENTNIADVAFLYNKRIGHGLNLVLFPGILEKIKKQKMLVELNPLSNQILGYQSDLRNHPGRILLKKGVQCSISSDDPGVFGYEGLSYDFFSAIFAWELDLKAIKKLVFNSIEYSSLSNADKKNAMQSLQKDWNNFVTYANKFLK